MVRQFSYYYFAVALFACLNCRIRKTLAIPMQMTVQQRSMECLYDTLEKGEKVTMSVIILSGTSLKATARLEGPIAPLDIDSTLDLTRRDMLPQGSKGLISVKEVVDFEHLNFAPETEDGDDDESSSDDHEEEVDPEDPDFEEKNRQRRARQRERFAEQKKKRERKRIQQQKKIRQDGEPFLRTEEAEMPGWYRVCVEGTWHQVIVEMEMRKESELGGLDQWGHVYDYDMKATMDEDKELEKDTASQEGIKDEDFQETREKVKELRRLLNEIQSMQQKERRRLTVHAQTNEHSHSRMVLSSLLETLLFMAITGYQIFTIRRWFSAAPVLGR